MPLVPPRAIDHVERKEKKKKQFQAWETSLQVAGQGSQETLKIERTSAIALGCFPELDVQTLLLRTPQTSNTGHGGIKQELV